MENEAERVCGGDGRDDYGEEYPRAVRRHGEFVSSVHIGCQLAWMQLRCNVFPTLREATGETGVTSVADGILELQPMLSEHSCGAALLGGHARRHLVGVAKSARA